MSSLFKAVRLSALLISLLATVPTVWGCGVMPPGQSRTRTFTLTGFTLPVAMVYSTTTNIPAQVPGIATTMQGAQQFVQRLVRQAVFDVLERQGRSAGLSDAIIAIILGQLTVQISYNPLQCNTVFVDPGPMMPNNIVAMMQENCIIIRNTVTSICNAAAMAARNMAAMCMTGNAMNILPIPPTALTIGGTISTTNIIMANWSREMWQGVLNRVVRTLASGPFGANFATASGIVA